MKKILFQRALSMVVDYLRENADEQQIKEIIDDMLDTVEARLGQELVIIRKVISVPDDIGGDLD